MRADNIDNIHVDACGWPGWWRKIPPARCARRARPPHIYMQTVSRRGPPARGRYLRPADLAREHPLHRRRKWRHWLLQHALNPVEVALSALLDVAEVDDPEHDDAEHDGVREDFGQAVPLARRAVRTRRSLPALVARRGNLQRGPRQLSCLRSRSAGPRHARWPIARIRSRGSIGAQLRDLADRVEPHAVHRATTPGGWRREVTLTPLLEDWDDSASSGYGPVP